MQSGRGGGICQRGGTRGEEVQAQKMLAEKGKGVFALGYGCCLVWWEGRCETAKECRLGRGRSSQKRW